MLSDDLGRRTVHDDRLVNLNATRAVDASSEIAARKAVTASELAAARTHRGEIQQQVEARQVDKVEAERAAADAEARAHLARDALAWVQRESAVAAAVVAHKETSRVQMTDFGELFCRQAQQLNKDLASSRSEMNELRSCSIEVKMAHAREIAKLTTAAEKGKDDVARKEVDCQALSADVQKAQRQLKESAAQAERLRRETMSAQKDATDAFVHLQQLREGLHELKRRDSVLKDEVAVLRNDVFAARRQVEELQRREAQLERQEEPLRNGETSPRAIPTAQVAMPLAPARKGGPEPSPDHDHTVDQVMEAGLDKTKTTISQGNALPTAPVSGESESKTDVALRSLDQRTREVQCTGPDVVDHTKLGSNLAAVNGDTHSDAKSNSPDDALRLECSSSKTVPPPTGETFAAAVSRGTSRSQGVADGLICMQHRHASQAQEVAAEPSSKGGCGECGEIKALFRDEKDGLCYCRDCWLAFYGHSPPSSALQGERSQLNTLRSTVRLTPSGKISVPPSGKISVPSSSSHPAAMKRTALTTFRYAQPAKQPRTTPLPAPADVDLTDVSTTRALAAVKNTRDVVNDWLLCDHCKAKWPPGSFTKGAFSTRRSTCKNHDPKCFHMRKYQACQLRYPRCR